MKRQKRTWTVDEKLAILKEAEEEGPAKVCRKHGIYPSTYQYWKKKYESQGQEGLKPQYVKRNDQELAKLKKENDQLKKLLAEKELALQLKEEMFKKKVQQWKNEGK